MRVYELTRDAEADLEEIVRHTIEQWGDAQARSYLGKISQCCKNIAKKKVVLRTFLEKFPDACVVRCEYHYVFYLIGKGEKPIIFAILHERMDMLVRLKDRLG